MTTAFGMCPRQASAGSWHFGSWQGHSRLKGERNQSEVAILQRGPSYDDHSANPLILPRRSGSHGRSRLSPIEPKINLVQIRQVALTA